MHADQLTQSLERIDGYNADDPNRFDDRPLARFQGERAHHWVLGLDPDASPALQIAARGHHIGRWELPRSEFDEGRSGYLRWRREQKKRHAARLTSLLSDEVDPQALARAVEIVQKKGLGSDPEVQTFEDAVCLTFIETQFLSTADKLADDEKMVEVVAKTLRKMSADGIAAAQTIDLDERSAAIVARAAARLG
ncbi:MAG: DUF4202 domain-containing protein [Acidimicrobiales bacterium]